MKCVLVIEDNPDNYRLIQYALSRAGYVVQRAGSGEIGVETAAPEMAFIVMDINLPGIDGYEATRQIRERLGPKAPPIIAITSSAMRGDREKVLDAGCSGYFEKPINPLTIIDQLHEALGGPLEDPDR